MQTKECTCPYCTGFRYKLEAVQEYRNKLSKSDECECSQCVYGSPWLTAFESPSRFRDAMTCGKIPFPGLESPSRPDDTPMLNMLECSLLPKTRKGGGGGQDEHFTYPENIVKCTKCGWDAVAPTDCPIDMSNDPVTWTEKQDGMGPEGEAVYCDRVGTRRELMECIRSDYGMVRPFQHTSRVRSHLTRRSRHARRSCITCG